MKKKVVKIIIIAILVMVLLCLIINLREAIIMYKLSNKVLETQKLTNYYYKAETESGINYAYKKDNIATWKLVSEEDTKQIYINDKEVWTIIESKDGTLKTAVKHIVNEVSFMPPVLMDGTLYFENFWQAFLMSFTTRISTEYVDDIECYKIYIAEDFQVFINKEDYIKIKEINGSTSRKLLEYSINTVTDSDVQMPNLEGFEVKEVR